MNNTTTRTLALVAVLTAATLVVGTFATVAATQPAFAIAKKPPGHGDKKYNKTRDNGSGNGNGNTVTIEECKNRGSASGFDTNLDQECENLICTHPGENATCTQEGVRSTPTPTPEPITTTLRVIKKVVCQPTDPNCSLPTSTCEIDLATNGVPSQTFTCQSAVGNGLLITLQPGDSFALGEVQNLPGPIFDVSFSSDCDGTIAAGQHLTCTITNTERGPG
jgi:hypothetical protein